MSDPVGQTRGRAVAWSVVPLVLVFGAAVAAFATGQPVLGGVLAVALALAATIALRAARGRAASAQGQDVRPFAGMVLEHVFDAVLDPIIVINERGTVLAANVATERVFGWPPPELVGRNVSVLMGEPYRAEHDGYIATYLATGVRRAIGRIRKVIGRRKDDSEFPCELSVSELHTPEGRRFVGVVRDISERERFAMQMAATERLAAVGELAAGLAHEVNNPLNTIINCAQMIKDGDPSPELRDYVLHEAMRIAGIVRELMNVAADRAEDYRHTDVHQPLQRALALLATRMRQARVTVNLDLAEGLPAVRARADRLQQVFLNLLLNALDALAQCERERRIDIVTRAESTNGESWVRIAVRDNGPGVPEYARERIFQPFFTTKKPGEGTGLGLAVSTGIVRDHGGTLQLHTEVGKFAEFVVSLPAAR
ncbi:MAG TPA: ATP-binding protein [Planctomycetota bacterium]|nr:ATP-binding protein [Planctomycetota bacterium]